MVICFKCTTLSYEWSRSSTTCISSFYNLWAENSSHMKKMVVLIFNLALKKLDLSFFSSCSLILWREQWNTDNIFTCSWKQPARKHGCECACICRLRSLHGFPALRQKSIWTVADFRASDYHAETQTHWHIRIYPYLSKDFDFFRIRIRMRPRTYGIPSLSDLTIISPSENLTF